MASTQITPLCLFVHLSGLEAWAQAPIASLESTSDQAEERQEFFSLLRMNRAVVDRYRVRIAGGPERPLEVDGWMVEDPLDDQRHDGMAARRGESDVELIAAWLE